MTTAQLATLLSEQRRFPPPPDFARTAAATPELYRQAKADRLRFWDEQARVLDWIAPWTKVLEWTSPHAKWYLGGKLNASVNCLDRHLAGPRRNKAALIWEGEPGDRRTLTYWELSREVNRAANALRRLGVKRGDRVAIYLPMIPEAAIAMLACARIGAVHSVVFGGFSAESLRDRIVAQQAVALITADGGYRRGQVLPLKRFADEALEQCPSIRNVIVVRRRPGSEGDEAFAHMQEGRDHWWHRLLDDAPLTAEPEAMDAEDMLFILYTSGTTGKPKGIVHTTGGYLVQAAVTTKYVFDLREDDVFWCTADIGWVTGHSYVVYGPLAIGATVLMLRAPRRLRGAAPPPLRRVRPAGHRGHGADVRGRPGLARAGSLLGDDRAHRGHGLLHRPDRDPRVHEVGRGASGPPRPLHAQAPGHGG